MTPEAQMQNVYAQVKAADEGRTNTITCPYCGGVNREDLEFCCDLFGRASIAALERIRVEQSIEMCDRISRHVSN